MHNEVQILLENPKFLIVNKPQGISVHNERPNEKSLLDILGPKLHLAHRLDKETSGVLVIAKTVPVANKLMEALSDKTAAKSYRAILRNSLHKKTPELQSMAWDWPITDKAEGRQNPQGKSSDRIKAETQVQIVRCSNYFSEIKAQILTGRQHQIRKHAAIAKHPVVGDPRYNDRVYNDKIFSIYNFERMLLHAETLRFYFEHHLFEVEAPKQDIFNKIMDDLK